MNAGLEKIMRQTATNLEALFSAEADNYADLDETAEKFIQQGFGEDLAFEMAFEKHSQLEKSL